MSNFLDRIEERFQVNADIVVPLKPVQITPDRKTAKKPTAPKAPKAKAAKAAGKKRLPAELVSTRYLKGVQIPEDLDPFTECDLSLITKIVTAFLLDSKVMSSRQKAAFAKVLAKKFRGTK